MGRAAVWDGRVWLGVALLVLGLTLAVALWRAHQQASADPAGWEINNSGGWRSGGCENAPTGPEDVTCTTRTRSVTTPGKPIYRHKNLRQHNRHGTKIWEKTSCTIEYESMTAADIGRGCAHNWPGYTWLDHKGYEAGRGPSSTSIVTEHRWVRRKAAHVNCPGFPFDHPRSIGGAGCPTTTTTEPAVCGRAPGAPTGVRVVDQQADPRVVRWSAPSDDGGEHCSITGYRVRVTGSATGSVRSDRYGPGVRRHAEAAPTPVSGVKTVQVQAENEYSAGPAVSVTLPLVCPSGTKHAGQFVNDVPDGDCDPGDDEVCRRLPGAPRVWASGDELVRWSAPSDDGGEHCSITGYRVRERASVSGTEWNVPYNDPDVRLHGVRSQVTRHSGTVWVEVAARNQAGLGPPGRVPLHPPVVVCPEGTDRAGQPEGGRPCDDTEPEPEKCASPPVLTAAEVDGLLGVETVWGEQTLPRFAAFAARGPAWADGVAVVLGAPATLQVNPNWTVQGADGCTWAANEVTWTVARADPRGDPALADWWDQQATLVHVIADEGNLPPAPATATWQREQCPTGSCPGTRVVPPQVPFVQRWPTTSTLTVTLTTDNNSGTQPALLPNGGTEQIWLYHHTAYTTILTIP